MIAIYLVNCLFFVLLQGFFTASEISFISSHLLKLHHRQDRGDKRASKVYQLLHQPEKFLVTTLIGTNLSLVLSSSFMTFTLMHLGLPESQLLTTLFFTPFVVIFAELIPKTIGRSLREDFSCQVVEAIYFFQRVFAPFVYIIESVLSFFMEKILGTKRRRSLFITKEEIRLLIKELQQEGGIGEGEKEAIEEVFDFKKRIVKDAGVILDKVATVNYDDTWEMITTLAKREGYTRYPVFKNKEILGYINIYDLFYNPAKQWQTLIRPLSSIGAHQKLYEALLQLKERKENIAFILDGTKVYGIITISDIMHEIIGSIMK